MKISHAIASAALGLIALAAFQTSHAQQVRRPAAMPAQASAAQPSWYIGGGLGRAEFPQGISDSTFHDGNAFTNTSLKSQTAQTMVKGFVGFKVNRNFAIEGGYMRLGEFGAERAYTGPDRSYSVKFTSRGFNLDLVGILPLAESFSLMARLGVIRLRSDIEGRVDGAVTGTDSSTKWAFRYGVGAQYDITRTFAIRGDYELIKKAVNSNMFSWAGGNEFEFQTFSASGIYKF